MEIKLLQKTNQETEKQKWIIFLIFSVSVLTSLTNLAKAKPALPGYLKALSANYYPSTKSQVKTDARKEFSQATAKSYEEGVAYYWVGGTGNWTDVNHWATSSGGTTRHTEIPMREDNVFFDENSFSVPNQTVYIDTLNADVKNLSWTGVKNNPTFMVSKPNPVYYTDNQRLNIYGSLVLSKDVKTNLKEIAFQSNEKGNIIDLGGNDLGLLRHTGTLIRFQSLGEYALISDFSAPAISFERGNLKTNGYTLNISNFGSNGSFMLNTLDLGSSLVKSSAWFVGEGTLNLKAGTSTIILEPGNGFGAAFFLSTNLVYHNVIFRTSGSGFESTNNTFNYVTLGGNITNLIGDNNYNTLTLEPGAIINFKSGTTQTVNRLIAVGERNNFIQVRCSQAGSQAVIRQRSGTFAGEYLNIKDMKAEGGAIFKADNSLDNGNNSGWHFTSPQGSAYYWVGGTGKWSDINHWATISGGKVNHTTIPSQMDDVVFDANSFFAPGQVVTVDVKNAIAKNLDWTNNFYKPAFEANSLNIYGSLNIAADIHYTLSSIYLRSDKPDNKIKISGKPSDKSQLSLIFEGSGEYLLQDELSADGIRLNHGTLNTNNQSVNIKWGVTSNYDYYAPASRSLILGNSEINIGFIWETWPDITLNAGTSTIRVSSNNIFNQSYFKGAGKDYHRVIFEGVVTLEHENTFDSLVFEPGSTIKLSNGYKQTVKNLIANGTENNKIQIETGWTGPQAIISQPAGTVNGKHLVLQDIKAEGGATFYALNSEDKGNNSGWLFLQEQIIAFDPISNKVLGDPPFALTATATSGLPVSFEIVSGPATIENNLLNIIGTGIVTVKAVQAGDAIYAPASEVIQTLEVLAKETPDGLAWNMRYGGSGTDRLTVVIKTKDGGYLVGGYSNSKVSGDKSQASQGGADYWILKTDAAGNKQWDQRYGGTDHDYLNRIIPTKDGGYLLAGSSLSGIGGDKTEASRGNQDYWIVKITATGEKEWDKTFGGTGFDDLRKVNQLPTGEYFLAGTSNSPLNGDKSQPSQGKHDYWVLKLTSHGTKVWDKRYGGSADEYLESFTKTSDGGFVLAGSSTSGISGDKTQASRGRKDYWLVRIDSNGNKLWDQRYGGSGQEELYSVGYTKEGYFFAAGHSTSGADGDKTEKSQGGNDFWMIVLNANGTKRWDKRFGGSGQEELRSIIQTTDGGYLLAGKSDSEVSGDKSQSSRGNTDYWVVKTDAAGNKIWDRRFGGTATEELRYIQQTNNGGYLLGGRSDSGVSGDRTQSTQGQTDYWLVKVPADGGPLAEPAATRQEARIIPEPETYAATNDLNIKAFPNPFSENITLSFTLPQNQTVSLTVYDSQGRKTAILYQGEAQARKPYRVKWQPGTGQAAGVYILKFQTGTKVSHQKVLYTR